MTNTGGVETQMGAFSMNYCVWLLRAPMFPPKTFAGAILPRIATLYRDFWITRRLISYPAIAETRGAETQIEAFTIHYCIWLAHVIMFPPKKFAGTILPRIAIFHCEFWTTCRLLYYAAMAETRGAEPHMAAVVIHYCGWLACALVFSH